MGKGYNTRANAYAINLAFTDFTRINITLIKKCYGLVQIKIEIYITTVEHYFYVHAHVYAPDHCQNLNHDLNFH